MVIRLDDDGCCMSTRAVRQMQQSTSKCSKHCCRAFALLSYDHTMRAQIAQKLGADNAGIVNNGYQLECQNVQTEERRESLTCVSYLHTERGRLSLSRIRSYSCADATLTLE